MALHIGNKAPDFTLPSTTGIFTLSKDLEGKPCILYFYPKNFTGVCTKEACAFGTEYKTFTALGIEVVGISGDTVESHLKFKTKYMLPFELLSDTDGSVAKKYKALFPFVRVTKRISYLLDKNHTIVGMYNKLLEAEGHVKEMLLQAKNLE